MELDSWRFRETSGTLYHETQKKKAISFSTAKKTEGLKLHLGCGNVFIPGFLHVDIISGPHIDYHCSVDNLPFSDCSVQLIYACHILEHFGRFEVEGVLSEWYRVLQPKGVLRLSVPDFAAIVDMYVSQGLNDGKTGLVGLVCGGQRSLYDFHKIIFDKPFLRKLLLNTGFEMVRDWNWRTTEHSHIDDYSQAYLPHLNKSNGRLMSLNLEAIK